MRRRAPSQQQQQLCRWLSRQRVTLAPPPFLLLPSRAQVMELLAEHLSEWSTHPALPELSHLACLQLRRFAKLTRVDKFRKAAKGLLEALDR